MKILPILRNKRVNNIDRIHHCGQKANFCNTHLRKINREKETHPDPPCLGREDKEQGALKSWRRVQAAGGNPETSSDEQGGTGDTSSTTDTGNTGNGGNNGNDGNGEGGYE